MFNKKCAFTGVMAHFCNAHSTKYSDYLKG